jgi:polyisoprenoid-binding protein YceI
MPPPTLLRGLALSVLLLTFLRPGIAGEDEPCAPFKNGRVDPALVSIMLKAADEGYLYRIHTESSRIGFCVDSDIERVEGSFQQFQGGVALDPYGIESEQILVLVKTDSLDVDRPFLDRLLKGVKFFDVRDYPDILFISTAFNWETRTTATIQGNLTMHGVTKGVTFYAKLIEATGAEADNPERIVVQAATVIHRSDFGMQSLQALVEDDVQLCLDIVAHRY